MKKPMAMGVMMFAAILGSIGVAATALAKNDLAVASESVQLIETSREFDSVLETSVLGATYCRKMLARCDAGDQSACDLFEKNCNPNN